MSGITGYRRDIDGLRAVAILPVLFYHAGIDRFSGGYVGVDVFFVISGFLITAIIAREIDARTFSIVDFYERRARRIMPALLAVILFVLAGAALLYLPGDFEGVPRSAILATLFTSNIGFFLETGYFAGGAETMPLLHTWSLAVEEQFYLGFPILLILIARFAPAWRIAIVAGIGLVSFALAVATQTDGSGFAFYLLPPRAWELFVGALLALGAVPTVRSTAWRELVALCGLGAIALAALTFNTNTVFPGVNALFPVLGAAALIHCAQGTWTGRLLGWAPLVWIGLISYSLYLWHWPLIVFTEYATDAPLRGWSSAGVVVLAFVAAILSWRFVEQPFRQRRWIGRKRLFAATATAMTAVGALAAAMLATNGWSSRFSPEVIRMAAARSDVSPRRDACVDSDSERGPAPCVFGDARPTALLWGDSHGVEFAWALSREMDSGEALVQRTRASCPPVLGYDPPGDPDCARINRQVFDAIRADMGIETVVLAGFWAREDYATPRMARALDETIAALRADGRRVVLIGPVPPQTFDVPRRLAHLARSGSLDEAVGTPRSDLLERTNWVRRHYPRWRALGVTIVDPADTLCGPRNCAIIRDGVPLYFDSHHISVSGARLVLASTGGLVGPSLVSPRRRSANPAAPLSASASRSD